MNPVPCGSNVLLLRNSDNVLLQMETDCKEHEVILIASKGKLRKLININ